MATAKAKDDLPTLKAKVTEVIKSPLFLFFTFSSLQLERQVNEYKSKLDELRRAKATTVVKLEKEYVNTSIPGFDFRFIDSIATDFYFSTV